jgi:hypothetical protein
LLGFDEENYECEYFHPDYVSEDKPVPSTLENLGLILINRNLHFESGRLGYTGERQMMLRTVSLTSFGLLFLRSCDKQLKSALDDAERREVI